MASAKNASRFAVLSVDDDDDDETGGFSTAKKRGGDKNSAKNFGPYVVAPNQGAKKKKRKGKPTTKAQGENNFDENVDEEDEFNKALMLSRQEFAETEQKRKEEEKVLDETLQNSLASTDHFKHSNKAKVYAFRDETKTSASASFEKPSSANASSKSDGPSSDAQSGQEQSPPLLSDVDLEAERIRKLRPNSAAGDASRAIVVLYRNKCLELKKVIEEKEDENAKLKADLDKIKQKNKIFFQLFKDAETKEKAEILHEINKVKIINGELTEQISVMDVELQQVKSRNHELENELKKLGASKGTKQ